MPDFPSFDELTAIATGEILVQNPQLSVEAVQREGSDANALVAAMAATGDQVVTQFATWSTGAFITTAQGDALDFVVFDRLGLVRKAASVAAGTVALITTTPNPSPFTVPVGTLFGTADGRQYSSTSVATFPAGSTGPVFVPIRSVLAGLLQQAPPNTITSIIGSIPASPSDLACTNPLATAGADDAEGDADFRARAMGYWLVAQRGTLAALQNAALGVPGIRRATAIEVLDSLGRPARIVQLIVADAYVDALATLGTVPPTYAVQSQQLTNAVVAAIQTVRAGGSPVEVIVAQVVLISVNLQLHFYAGSDPTAVAQQAQAAVVNYINALQPGQRLQLIALSQVFQNIPGLAFFGDEIVTPVGDIIPNPTQVLRTTLGIVTTSGLGQTFQNVTTPSTAPVPRVPVISPGSDISAVNRINSVNLAAATTALQASASRIQGLYQPLVTQLTLAQLLNPNILPISGSTR